MCGGVQTPRITESAGDGTTAAAAAAAVVVDDDNAACILSEALYDQGLYYVLEGGGSSGDGGADGTRASPPAGTRAYTYAYEDRCADQKVALRFLHEKQ
jgi:hypothetical protein